MSTNKSPLGVIGVNALQVARSAERAGYDVYLVDYHMDYDRIRGEHHPLQSKPYEPNLKNEYSAAKLVDYAINELEGKVDDVLLTSAIGCNPYFIEKIEKKFCVLGNSSRIVHQARNPNRLKKLTSDEQYLIPETVVFESEKELFDAAQKVGYPHLIKPCFEGCGIPNRINHSREDVKYPAKSRIKLLVQEKIEGIPLSCTILADGTQALAYTVNRQLIGLKEFNAPANTYCGNIVPYETPERDKIIRCSEKIASNLGLLGANGLDYILNDDGLYLLEVNTRIPDTIWGVEQKTGVNLVQDHNLAIGGLMNYSRRVNKGFWGKAIVYSDGLKQVKSEFRGKKYSNIPPTGSLIQANEPICCVYANGLDYEKVLVGLENSAKKIHTDYLKSAITR